MFPNCRICIRNKMKEKINQINQSIEEKRDRLREKIERSFSTIVIPSNRTKPQGNSSSKKDSLPPISYILYGVAGLAALGSFASDSKILCLGVAAASAYGGYRLSKKATTSGENTSSYSQIVNIGSVRNEITSKVLDSVKLINKEWEEFMELKQKEVLSSISTSSYSDNEKDSMSSKIFVYEVIDISISELSSMINTSTDVSEIINILSSYKEKVLSAIDDASRKQMLKYNSLVS